MIHTYRLCGTAARASVELINTRPLPVATNACVTEAMPPPHPSKSSPSLSPHQSTNVREPVKGDQT